MTRPFVLTAIAGLAMLLLLPHSADARTFISNTNLSQTGDVSPRGSVVTDSSLLLRWAAGPANDIHVFGRPLASDGLSFGPAQDITQAYNHFFPNDDPSTFANSQTDGSRVYQVWAEQGKIDFRRSDDGGSNWAQPQVISGSETAIGPAISVDGDNVFVWWIVSSTLDVIARASHDGGQTWGPPANLGVSGAGVTLVAVTGGRGVLVTFADADTQVITLKTYTSGNFGDPPAVTVLSPAPGGSGEPVTEWFPVIAPGGQPLVEWTWARGDHETAFYTYSDDGGVTWKNRQMIDQGAKLSFPSFAAGGDTWYFNWLNRKQPSDHTDTLYVQSYHGDNLRPQTPLATVADAGGLFIGQPGASTADADNTAFVSWQEPGAGHTVDLLLATLQPGQEPSVSRLPTGLQDVASMQLILRPLQLSASGAAVAGGRPVYLFYWGGSSNETPRDVYVATATVTGDTDCIGGVTATDVLGVLAHAASPGATPLPCLAAADVNCDGAVTPSDALIMLDVMAGLDPVVSPQPCSRVGT